MTTKSFEEKGDVNKKDEEGEAAPTVSIEKLSTLTLDDSLPFFQLCI